MPQNKTQPTAIPVLDFLNAVDHPTRKADGLVLHDLMAKASGEPAVMWGPSIVGYGTYHYKYDTGREGDFLKIGFSPRKASLTLYLMNNFEEKAALLQKLGKHKVSKGCIYINKLADVDLNILEQLIVKAYASMTKKYG